MIQTILSRRSIRKFKADAISEEHIQTIINAGMHAPSARNLRPRHFIIVDDASTLKKLSGHGLQYPKAPVCIFVCGDTGSGPNASPVHYVNDCAAALENMLLAAVELGLGACWLGISEGSDRAIVLSKELNLPAHIKPSAGIVLGYADETKEPENRFNAAIVHRNKW